MQLPQNELTATLAQISLTSPVADKLPALRALQTKLRSGGEDAATVIDEDLFQVFGVLASLFSSEQDEVRNEAMACVEALGEQASPREMLLAVQEQMGALGRPKGGISFDDEDDEDEAGDAEAGPSGITGSAAAQMALALMSLLSTVISRVKTKKPSAFLQPLIRSVSRCVAGTRSCPSSTADELLATVVALIETADEWAQRSSINQEGQQAAREDLTALLLSCFAELGPRLSVAAAGGGGGETLAEGWFFDKRPGYRVRKGKAVARSGSDDAEELWAGLRSVVHKLDIELMDVAQGLKRLSTAQADEEEHDSDSSSAERAAIQLGAFMLFVMDRHRQTLDGQASPLPSHTPEDTLGDMQRSMPILTAAFHGVAMRPPGLDADEESAKSAAQVFSPSFFLADCGLSYLQWLLYVYRPTIPASDTAQQLAKRPLPSDTLLLPLIQLLSTYAALCPSPPHRMISWTLLREEMKELMGEGEADALVVDLLRDLVTESPFPQLRAAAVGMCRELLGERLRLGAGDGKAIQAWRTLFTTSIFVLPPSPDSGDSASRLASYLSEHASLLIEQLNVAYFLLVRGARDEGTRAVLDTEALRSNLVEPLRRWLEAVKEGDEVEQGDIIETVLSQVEERFGSSSEAQQRP